MSNTKKIGDFGENFACRKLRSKGYKILCRNYRQTVGEIDIIAENEECIVFVEVKTRGENYLFEPVFAVTKEKQRKIIKTAQIYLLKNETTKQPRFDVFEVVTRGGILLRVKEYTHTENAFWL